MNVLLRNFKFWIASFIYLVLLTSPTLYYYIATGDYKRLFLSFVVASGIYAIPIFFFHKNPKRYFNLLFIFIILAPIFIYPVYAFRTEIVHRTLLMIIESSMHDKMGFLQGINPVSILPVLFFYGIGYTALQNLPTNISRPKALSVSIVALLFPLCLAGIPYKAYSYGDRLEILIARFYPTKYFLLFLDGDLQEYFNMDNNRKNTVIKYRGIKKESKSKEKEIYVFLLGETARKDRFSLFGYEKKTTPQLDTTKNLIPLQDFYADGHCTMYSAPMILTGTEVDSFDTFYKQSGLIQEMQHQGFEDVWIGSKYSRGTNSVDIFSREAKERIIPGENCCHEADVQYDEVLLQPLSDKIQNSSAEKLFIVIHFIGSHWNYSSHYPSEFSKFKPNGKGESTEFLNEESYAKIRNDYDNTIYYTDYLLSKVIKTIRDENAVSFVYYISDHGENLFDDDRKLYTHLNATEYTQKIPAFVWYSDQYKFNYLDKLSILKENSKSPAMGSNSFFTFLDLANVELTEKDSKRSLASPNYQSPEIKFITEKGVKNLQEIQ